MNTKGLFYEEHRACLELTIEGGFIANGMTPSELRRRLEMEICSWVMVGKEKSEG